MSKLPYREGTWFAVPLAAGVHAVGVVARVGPQGRVVFGYFFGPRGDELPSMDELRNLGPGDAVIVTRFGDLFLWQGKWPILGQEDEWQRARWPMPAFSRSTEIGGSAWRVEYRDDDPNSLARETRITSEEAEGLPEAALFGAGAVEEILRDQLGGTPQFESRRRH